MVQKNSFYYKETPGIRNVSTREKFTVIKDTTSVSGVTYEGRCQLPLDQALTRLDEAIWQLWRSGTRSESGSHIAEGISERSYGEIWDDRLAIFGDTLSPFQNEFSIDFDGISKFVNAGAVANFERTQAFSVSTWFKTSQSTVAHLINRIQNGTPFRGWQFYKSTAQKLTFSLINNASSNSIQVNGDSVLSNDGDWHNAVMTYDGSSNANGVKMYLDANPEVVSIITDTLSATTLHTQDMLIGKRSDNAGHLDGKQDEPSIIDRVWTPAEVTANYNLGVPINLITDFSADLVSWLRFTQIDKDNFPIIADHSLNGNDGLAINMLVTDIQGDVPA